MDKLLGFEEVVEITRLKYKLVTSRAQKKQLNQLLTT
jgi:hypothetical protein